MSRVLKTGKETKKEFSEDLSKLQKKASFSSNSPNPKWKPGTKIKSPFEGAKYLELDPSQLDSKSIYPIMLGGIVPRPIAFVSTLNENGSTNLAPFSAYNLVCSNPPTLSISIARKKEGEKKDTLKNIERTREFVVNCANEWLAEPLHHCSAPYPSDQDELTPSGLTAIPSSKVKSLRIQESAIQFECQLLQSLEIGDGKEGSSTLVIGKIIYIHIAQPALQQGKIQLDAIQPLSRLGGRSYGRTSGVFDLPQATPYTPKAGEENAASETDLDAIAADLPDTAESPEPEEKK